MIKASARVDLSGFAAAEDEIMRAIADNLGEVAATVEREAKTTSAFADKTGKLRRSIKSQESKFMDGGGYIVKATAPHAHLIEFGHVLIAWGKVTGKRVSAHPFLRPAKEQGIIKAIEVFMSR